MPAAAPGSRELAGPCDPGHSAVSISKLLSARSEVGLPPELVHGLAVLRLSGQPIAGHAAFDIEIVRLGFVRARPQSRWHESRPAALAGASQPCQPRPRGQPPKQPGPQSSQQTRPLIACQRRRSRSSRQLRVQRNGSSCIRRARSPRTGSSTGQEGRRVAGQQRRGMMRTVQWLRWSTSSARQCRGGIQAPPTVCTPCAAYDLAGVVIVIVKSSALSGLPCDAAACRHAGMWPSAATRRPCSV